MRIRSKGFVGCASVFHFIILSAAVFSILAMGYLGGAQAGDFRDVQVRFVPDGDTLVLQSGEVMRLSGIDAPETAKKDTPGQVFAKQARKRLAELVMRRTVTVLREQSSLDVHGRTLALVRLEDGRWVNEMMVAEGLAFVYPHKDGDKSIQERLLQAQRKAMEESRGFWPVILNLPSANAIWLGNENSKRFHRSGCRQVPVRLSQRWIRFDSLKQAFYAGFSPSRECTPWPVD